MAHLIDKDALVAEIKKCIYRCNEKKRSCPVNTQVEAICDNKINAYNEVLSSLDTLEVKEVDLDFQTFAKEMDVVFALPSSKTENTEEEPLNWEYAIAKHFFELGIKAQRRRINNEQTS